MDDKKLLETVTHYVHGEIFYQAATYYLVLSFYLFNFS